MHNNFDKDLKETLGNYRYRKYRDPEIPEVAKVDEIEVRKTRSGHNYALSLNNIVITPKDGMSKVILIDKFSKLKTNKNRSILKKKIKYVELGIPPIPDITPYFDMTELKGLSRTAIDKISKFVDKKVSTNFKNAENCVVRISLKPDNEHRKVKFSHLEVIYI